MNITKVLVAAAITAGAVLLASKLWNDAQLPEAAAEKRPPLAGPKVTHVIENTLHKHEGEESPMVQAFAEALEEKHAPG